MVGGAEEVGVRDVSGGVVDVGDVGGGVVDVGEITVTDVAADSTVAPVLSVTCSMKFQVPVAVEVDVTKL